jgi:lipopolysaccharide export system protein LptA
MIRVLAVVLALLFAAPAFAADLPIEVTADTFTVDESKNQAVFDGSVVITREGLDMRAQTVRISYGEGGQTDIRDLVATGNVRIRAAGQDAVGDRATFDPRTQILKLTGNVRVSSAQGTVQGPDLTIDLARNTSVFSGGSGGRVTGVFTPQ